MNASQKERITTLLTEIKETCFNDSYKEASDEEAMGLLISSYFSFDGIACLKAASYALELRQSSVISKQSVDLLQF